MNKYGIKIYPSGVLYVDGVYYSVNSIIYQDLSFNKYSYRLINNRAFGIYLSFNKKYIV